MARDGFGVLAATIGFGDCRMTWRRAGADAGHNHSAVPLPQRRVRAVLPPALTASPDGGRDGRAQEHKNVGRNAEIRNFADMSMIECGFYPYQRLFYPWAEPDHGVSIKSDGRSFPPAQPVQQQS